MIELVVDHAVLGQRVVATKHRFDKDWIGKDDGVEARDTSTDNATVLGSPIKDPLHLMASTRPFILSATESVFIGWGL